MANGRWLKTSEAAKALGIANRTVRSRFSAGTLQRKRENGNYLYFVEDAEVVPEVTQTLVNEDLDSFSWESHKTKISEKETQAYIDAHGVAAFLEYLKNEKVTSPVHVTPVTKGDRRKILSLSDIHFPFENRELIDSIVAEHSDADILVLNGDILDSYSVSSFGKDKHVLLLEEYMKALDFLIEVSKIFSDIYIVRGNHDQRAQRYISSKLDPETHILGRTDLLDALSRGIVLDESGNEVAKYNFSANIHYNLNHLPWMCKIGKTVFMHPHSYTSKTMGTVEGCLTHLQNFVPWDSFDSVVIGHTHKVGKVVERNKLLIEQGSLTKVMDYLKVGINVRRPQVNGYAIIWQDEHGNTDFNLSGFIFSGTLQYISE